MTAGVIAAAILGGGASEASGLVGSASSRADVDAQVSSAMMLDATLIGLTDSSANLDGDTNVRTDIPTSPDRGGATITAQAAGTAGVTAADLRTNSTVDAGSTVRASVQGDGDTCTPNTNTSANAQVAANVGANISVTGRAAGGTSATVDGDTSTDITVGLGIPAHLKGSGLLGVSLH